MEQSEVVLRAIGILTHSAERIRTAGQDLDAGSGLGEGQIGSLLAEVFPSFQVAGDATPLEAAHSVTEAALPAIMQLIGAFSFVFAELADVHDAGRTDISSADLLRELALRMSRPDPAA
ncbi:hypothetical protein ABZ707_14870 [Streptomyces sp. NPDC006923]|uniref:hypothetical protein n=1 Tax=Streptomyces sp. NPDC006923 TaxID=3155355 RepID=UPI0033D40C72